MKTIPGSSKYVKFAPFHLKKLPRGRNFTYLEDPGMNMYMKWSLLVTETDLELGMFNKAPQFEAKQDYS